VTPRILIAGIGNVLLQDDGLGPHVVARLEAEYEFDHEVELLDIGTPTLDFVDYLRGREVLVLVDALGGGGQPGEILTFDKEQLKEFLPNMRLSAHQPCLHETLHAAEISDIDLKDVLLVGIIGLTVFGAYYSKYARIVDERLKQPLFANTAKIGSMDIIYGLTANNNPTVQDVWNTTPAWGFPYAASNVAPAPGTHTLIEGAFAAHVGSVGAYTLINDVLYLEATAYRTLDPHTQNSLGTDPFGAPGLLDGVAPYWRAAIEPHWGDHWFMMGAFGMLAKVAPWLGPGNPVGTTATYLQTDNYTDAGVDAQYQYQGSGYWLTLRGSYIREFQQLNASFANGLASNPTNDLHSLKLQASAALGGDNRVVLTAQYFNTWGSPDPLLYGGLASGLSPDSNGWMAEIAYIPYGLSQAPGWPWANVRIALQYTWYNRFDGTTFGAQNNNTLFLHAWFAM